jgi:hypothetical protein
MDLDKVARQVGGLLVACGLGFLVLASLAPAWSLLILAAAGLIAGCYGLAAGVDFD